MLLGLLAVFMVAIVALLLFALGPSAPRLVLPNPNGYNDFVKAGEGLTGDVNSYRALGADSLGGLLSSNAESLKLVRLGLSRKCLMPLDPALTNAGAMLSEMTGMKRLTQLLAAEGWSHELAGEFGSSPPSAFSTSAFSRGL